jgi:hypothetical protein
VPAWVSACRLRPPVLKELEALYAGGVLRPGGPDLDPATMDHLRPLPDEAGVSALRELASLNFQRLWNLSAFFVGICRSRGGLAPLQQQPRGARRSRSPPLRTAGPPPWMESPPPPGAGGRAPGGAALGGRSPPGRQPRSPPSPQQRGGGGGGYRGGSPPPGRGRGRSVSPVGAPRRERDPYAPGPPRRPGSPGGAYSYHAAAARPAARGGLPGPPGMRGAEPPHHPQQRQQQQSSPVSPLADGGAYQHQHYDGWAAGQPHQHHQHHQQDHHHQDHHHQDHHHHQQQQDHAEHSGGRARYGGSPLSASGGGPPPATAYGGVKITSLSAWDAPALPGSGADQQHQHQHEQHEHDPWQGQQQQQQQQQQQEEAAGQHGGGGGGRPADPGAAAASAARDGGMFDVPRSSLDQWPAGSPVRAAVTDLVKELLKPSWKAQRIVRAAYKAVAKKSVEKVLASVALAGPHALPDTPAGAAQLLGERTRRGLHALVEGYVALAERHGLEALLAAA